MDSLHYDAYSTYSDSSAPRTPSPNASLHSDLALDEMHYAKPSPSAFKTSFEPDLLSGALAEHARDPHHHHAFDPAAWPTAAGVHPGAYSFAAPPHHHHAHHQQGTLLGDLYEHDVHSNHGSPGQDVYAPPHQHAFAGPSDWASMSSASPHTLAHPLPQMRPHHEVNMVRRNTFPYVRQDHDPSASAQGPYPHHHAHQQPSFMDHHHAALYHQQQHHLSLSAEPSALHHAHDGFMSNSPRGSYRDFDRDDVKLEEQPSVIVPSQGAYYPAPPPGAAGLGHPFMPSHAGLPVQHTDDAASKETQYLRRRCFNCHTTEPPSWRRSTLNPGKIVCNKCGLYERTHLRPRPLRFDELRAGNKARKPSKAAATAPAAAAALAAHNAAMASPKPRLVKKESRDVGLSLTAEPVSRRASVSSNASSVNGASSDWDDSSSIYSNGSAPGSGFNSPALSAFSISRDSASASPPMGGHPSSDMSGLIRLPNAPLSDIAGLDVLGAPPPSAPPIPRKSATGFPRGMPPSSLSDPAGAFLRRNTVTLPLGERRSELADVPEATGWHAMPMMDGRPGTPQTKVLSVA